MYFQVRWGWQVNTASYVSAVSCQTQEFQIKAHSQTVSCLFQPSWIHKKNGPFIDRCTRGNKMVCMFPQKTTGNCCETANTDAWLSLDSIDWIQNVRFIMSAKEERFVFPSGGASYLPPCSRSYQMKPVEGRSPWLPPPSSRTALGLKLRFHKYIKRCFSAFIRV